MTENLTKICLSVIFLLCLFHMPYGYYQAVRFLGTIGFIILVYLNYIAKGKINLLIILYAALAVLFQPFIKVSLGRIGWNITDVLVSIFLIASLFNKTKSSQSFS